MKSITVVAYNRPHYFKKMLFSLIQNDLNEWRIFFSIDPSEYSDIMVNLIKETIADKTNYQVKINAEKMGIEKNTYSSLQLAFDAGSELNIYLEEDLMISPDVTRLADWYYGQDHEQIMCLNLLYGACGGVSLISKDIPRDIVKTKQFNSYGFVLTSSQWLTYFKPYWFDYSHGFTNKDGNPMLGWDWAVFKHNLKEDRNLFVLQPVLARANHIGREGIFCKPEFYEKTFANLQISNYSHEIRYKIKENLQ